MGMNRREFIGLSFALAAMAGCRAPFGGTAEKRWYKGLFHCHSLWSDGKAFPEQVADWYRSHGYNFLGISDHNQFQDHPDTWATEMAKPKGWHTARPEIFERYLATFPDARTRKDAQGARQARLKTFAELQRQFDVPGVFRMMPATEFTHMTTLPTGVTHKVHMNVVNVPGMPAEYLQDGYKPNYTDKSVEAIVADRAALAASFAADRGRRHLFVLNHPIWQWYDIAPEVLVENADVRFFEACNNGSPHAAWHELPQDGLDTDRFWDVVNAFRARRGQPLLYGVGNDDTHFYFGEDVPMLMPGNAWTRVRARSLEPDALVGAMLEGDFLACEGIEAEDVQFDRARGELTVSVAGEPGEARKITFIVSKRDFGERPVRTLELTPEKPAWRRTIRIYDEKVGMVVKTVVGKPGEPVTASYRLAADDLYVRARIESPRIPLCKAALHPRNACCWTQPYQA